MAYLHDLNPVVALDLGTTKFCLATLSEDKGAGLPRIETISVAAEGMRRGMLASIEQAREALTKLVEMAEGELTCDLRKVVVGVAGSHLQSRHVVASLRLGGAEVTAHTLAALSQQASLTNALVGRELLHVVALAYQLDERGWVDNPLGFTGGTIHARFFVVEADKAYLADMVRLCNACGLEVVRLFAEPLASSSVITDATSRHYGLVTADIGGGTTDGLIYVGGKAVKTFTVNIAGKLMTSDLAIGLGIASDEAEHLKLTYGLERFDDSPLVEVRGVDGQLKRFRRSHVHEILEARIDELARLVYAEIKDYVGQIKAGILLTGGGSEVKQIESYLSRLLGKTVTREHPVVSAHNFPLADVRTGDDKRYLASKYATVVGLLHLEVLEQLKNKNLRRSYFFEKYFHQFFNWLKELA